MRPSLVPWLLSLPVLFPSLPAQDPGEPAFDGNQQAPGPRFDTAPTLALLRGAADKVEAETVEARTTVADSRWRLLAFLTNGSTMRVGPDKDRIKVRIAALRQGQDDEGWFTQGSARVARWEQLLAALATAQCQRVSNYKLLLPTARKAGEAIVAGFTADGDAPIRAEETALLAVLAVEYEAGGHADLGLRLRELATAGRAGHTPGRDRRTDAALHLAGLYLGEPHPAALTVARCWPANPMSDPLHTLIGVLALRTTDAATWTREIELLTKLLAQRIAEGEHAGAWPAIAGSDVMTTAAMLTTAIGIANDDPFAAPRQNNLARPPAWPLPVSRR